jgi:acetylornithine/succinyldiaminopimelate/putrescine aminotransferase
MAAMKVLLEEKWMDTIKGKEELFRSLLNHPKIRSVRSFGLWLAIEFDSFETNKKVIDKCIEQGVLADWFLFASNCLRISPPLVISETQIQKTCSILLKSMNSV